MVLLYLLTAGSFMTATPACVGFAMFASGAKLLKSGEMPKAPRKYKDRGTLKHSRNWFGVKPRDESKAPENY